MRVRTLLRSLAGQQASGLNLNAVVTVPAPSLNGNEVRRHVLRTVIWSYTAAPVGGRLTVESPAGTVLVDFDITAAGPGPMSPELLGGPNAALIVTLYAAGAGITGKLNVLTYLTEPLADAWA